MNSIAFDIVLLPDKRLEQQSIAVSEQLTGFNTFFTLREGVCFPHISLYMLQLKVANLERVTQLLRVVAAHTPTITLTAKRYYMGGSGFFDVEYTHTAPLDAVKHEVLETINPLRDGLREHDKIRIRTATGEVLHNLQRYGYQYTGALARPHITITRFVKETAVDIDTLPAPETFNGSFSALGLFALGPHGTCVRKIAEFALCP